MDTRICMPESLCCPLETITTLLIGHAPVQNKKLKKKNLPSSAGDSGSIPGQETKIPPVARRLSLCAATREKMQPGSQAPQLRPNEGINLKKFQEY